MSKLKSSYLVILWISLVNINFLSYYQFTNGINLRNLIQTKIWRVYFIIYMKHSQTNWKSNLMKESEIEKSSEADSNPRSLQVLARELRNMWYLIWSRYRLYCTRYALLAPQKLLNKRGSNWPPRAVEGKTPPRGIGLRKSYRNHFVSHRPFFL